MLVQAVGESDGDHMVGLEWQLLYFSAENSSQMFCVDGLMTGNSVHLQRLCLSLVLYLKVRAGLTMAQTMVRT